MNVPDRANDARRKAIRSNPEHFAMAFLRSKGMTGADARVGMSAEKTQEIREAMMYDDPERDAHKMNKKMDAYGTCPTCGRS